MIFQPAKYRGKWAVYDTTSRVWYFSKSPGKSQAYEFAARLNREVKA